MNLTLLFLLVYLVAVLAIGVLWRRRAGRDEASFFLADRSLNTFWGFIGLASLTTGGSTTVALAAFVYMHGLSGLWLDFAGALGLFALALLLQRNDELRGYVAMQLFPGRPPVQVEFGGQVFFGRRHQVCCLYLRFVQHEGMRSCAMRARDERFYVERANPGGEARTKLRENDARLLQFAHPGLRQCI